MSACCQVMKQIKRPLRKRFWLSLDSGEYLAHLSSLINSGQFSQSTLWWWLDMLRFLPSFLLLLAFLVKDDMLKCSSKALLLLLELGVFCLVGFCFSVDNVIVNVNRRTMQVEEVWCLLVPGTFGPRSLCKCGMAQEPRPCHGFSQVHSTHARGEQRLCVLR